MISIFSFSFAAEESYFKIFLLIKDSGELRIAYCKVEISDRMKG